MADCGAGRPGLRRRSSLRTVQPGSSACIVQTTFMSSTLPLAGHHLALERLEARRSPPQGRESGHVPEEHHVVHDGDLDVDVGRAVGHVAHDARHLEPTRQDVLVVRVVEDAHSHRGERRVDERLGVAVTLGTARGRPVPLQRVARRTRCARRRDLRRPARACWRPPLPSPHERPAVALLRRPSIPTRQ